MQGTESPDVYLKTKIKFGSKSGNPWCEMVCVCVCVLKITKTGHVWEMKCCGTGNTITDTFPQSGSSGQGSPSTNTEYDIQQTSLYMTTLFFVPSLYVISYSRSMPYPTQTMCLVLQAGSSFLGARNLSLLKHTRK